jgi:hypothetical protein
MRATIVSLNGSENDGIRAQGSLVLRTSDVMRSVPKKSCAVCIFPLVMLGRDSAK